MSHLGPCSQARTVRSYSDVHGIAPEVPFAVWKPAMVHMKREYSELRTSKSVFKRLVQSTGNEPVFVLAELGEMKAIPECRVTDEKF